MSFKKRILSALPFIIISLILGGFIGWLISKNNSLSTQEIKQIRGGVLRQNSTSFRFI